MQTQQVTIEACVESAAEAVSAFKAGATRVEMCSRLDCDGMTPDLAEVKKVLDAGYTQIKVMIRPQAEGFFFTESDLRKSIEACSAFFYLGIRQFVFGALTKEGKVDTTILAQITEALPHAVWCFHKAIDLVSDQWQALEDIATFPTFGAILTSGASATAIEGRSRIQEIQNRFGDRFEIIAAGKITHQNLTRLRTILRVPAYHGRKIVEF